MKIVRLTENNGSTALFDNVFNDEIELPPFSEIALSSVSVNVEPDVMVVSDSSRLEWLRGETSVLPSLKEATYDNSNFGDLFFNMEGNLNAAQTPELENEDPDAIGLDAGRQWAVGDNVKTMGFGKQGFVSIGYLTANHEGADSTAYEQNNVIEVSSSNPLAREYSQDAAGTASSIISKEPLGWGRARFYANMKILNDNGGALPTQGVYMGLSTVDHIARKTKPTVGDETTLLALHIPFAGEQVVVYQRNDEQTGMDEEEDVGESIDVGDMYGFETMSAYDGYPEGYIRCVRYFPDGTVEDLITSSEYGTYEYGQLTHGERGSQDPNNKPLYPFVIFLGDGTDSVINQVQLSPDPYVLLAKKTYALQTKTTGLRGMQNKGTRPRVSFDFASANSLQLGRYLGFSDKLMAEINIPIVAKEPNHNFTGDIAFGQGLKGQGFYVELMTGTCEGYDGQTGQRKNILAVIPESDSDDKILFQPSFPTFLEMNNSHPLVLRNIRARLLQTDGTPVSVKGLNSLTLLYKPGKS